MLAIFSLVQYKMRAKLTRRNLSKILTVILPRGMNGNYRFIVVTDVNKNLDEAGSESDNVTVSSETVVIIPPTPDLQVSMAATPSNVFSGQTIQVGWTVLNAGTGPTLVSSWQDQIYLSLGDSQLDANDRLLVTRSHSGELQAGGSYTVNGIDVTLPTGSSGPAFFIVITDSTNLVFEDFFEANNTSTRSVVINDPTPSAADLSIASVTRSSVLVGENFIRYDHGSKSRSRYGDEHRSQDHAQFAIHLD